MQSEVVRLESSEPVSKTQFATRTLRDAIIDLTLAPGENIDEKHLQNRYGFGRTPLREALNRLISEGLIQQRGTRGLCVAPLNLEEVRELFDAYILCERMVASVLVFSDEDLVHDLRLIEARYEDYAAELDFLKVTGSNAAFHNRLARATQNALITRYSEQLANLARRVSFYIFKNELGKDPHTAETNARIFDRAIEEHRSIIAAVESGERDKLVGVVTGHATYFRDRLRNLIGGKASFEVDFHID